MCPREFKMINEIGFGVNQTGIAKNANKKYLRCSGFVQALIAV